MYDPISPPSFNLGRLLQQLRASVKEADQLRTVVTLSPSEQEHYAGRADGLLQAIGLIHQQLGALPKPTEVRAGQRWLHEHSSDYPRRIESISLGSVRIGLFGEAYADDLLNDDRWIYLGESTPGVFR